MICEVAYEGSIECSICSVFCHGVEPCSVTREAENYSLKMICQFCIKKEEISEQRNLARANQVKQADKMLSTSGKRFKPLEVGENVSVPV